MPKDKRPDPKPRRNALLWQQYLWWEGARKRRVAFEQRLSTIEKGKSTMDAQVERDLAETMDVYGQEKALEAALVLAGRLAGPIWDWGTSLKGLGSGLLLARLLAYVDYPAAVDGGRPDHAASISKLWRHLGLGVVDGRAESGTRAFNRKAKALLLGPTGIADQFIRNHTYPYREIYDDEKERLRAMHPTSACSVCGKEGVLKGTSWRCPDGCKQERDGKKIAARVDFTPMHLHRRALRKMVKVFLSHLWLVWREVEGLPVTEPWVLAHGGHVDFIPPPNWPMEPKNE